MHSKQPLTGFAKTGYRPAMPRFSYLIVVLALTGWLLSASTASAQGIGGGAGRHGGWRDRRRWRIRWRRRGRWRRGYRRRIWFGN